MKRKALESINYSFVPNHQATMEALARARLSGREFRAILFILNQTDGYLRPDDTIRPAFFEERTGISKAHLANALTRLRHWNIVWQQKHVFKVNPPQQWAAEAFADSPKTVNSSLPNPDTNSPKTVNVQRVKPPHQPVSDTNSPKTVNHSPKTVKTLTENGEKQICTKDNTKDNLLKTTRMEASGLPPGLETPASKYLFEKTGRKRWANQVQKESFEKAEAEVGEARMIDAINWALESGISNIKSMVTAAKRGRKGDYGEPGGHPQARFRMGTRAEFETLAEEQQRGQANGSGAEGTGDEGQRPAPGDEGDAPPVSAKAPA